MTTIPTPFRIEVSDAVLDDLHDRLVRTRLPRVAGGGMDAARLASLVEHWLTAYDWRTHEARLNEYPQFTAEVGGETIHFVHLRSLNPAATPIVLTHGWPYTFAEMLPLADALRDDFHVVVPSLPGYVFSAAPAEPLVARVIGEKWNELMTGVLGYERYLTYGEDVGAAVSDYLAASHPESVAAIFATHAAFTPDSRRAGESAEETAFFEWIAAKWARASGYSAIQGTRPDTLAAGLSDSPSGLAAWIVEKLEEWSDGDAFTNDDVLTTVMLYWITNSIGSSFRSYFDYDRAEMPVIAIPASVAVQVREREYPRAMADRNYSDLRHFSHLPRGGHFTAREAPDLLAARLRDLVARLG